MLKTFVLDTNVLLHEPQAVFRFDDNDVVLPIYVIEELDNFKRDMSELGRNARECSRLLDQLRKEGDLQAGVKLEGGGHLRVIHATEEGTDTSWFAEKHVYDNMILRTALELKARHPDQPVIFVTQDTNLRIRADAAGLESVDYDPGQVEISQLYAGHREIGVSPDDMQAAFDDGLPQSEDDGLFANEYVLLRDLSRENHTALARFDGDGGCLRALPRRRAPIFGVQARNKEQSYALDLLLDDDVKLVTLVGKAGTGKTLLALAAGLHMVTDKDSYERLLVSRPIFPLGRDIGFLPGTVEEKLDPWMKPIYDNVEYLLGLNHDGRRKGPGVESLVDMGVLEIEPLTYIRGRSIPNQYMIIDEAQNLTPHEVKTIMTRAGEGTKLVFTGDPYQIDNPYVDSTNNGLVHLVGKFQGQSIAGTVTLTRGERSALAELAANLL